MKKLLKKSVVALALGALANSASADLLISELVIGGAAYEGGLELVNAGDTPINLMDGDYQIYRQWVAKGTKTTKIVGFSVSEENGNLEPIILQPNETVVLGPARDGSQKTFVESVEGAKWYTSGTIQVQNTNTFSVVSTADVEFDDATQEITAGVVDRVGTVFTAWSRPLEDATLDGTKDGKLTYRRKNTSLAGKATFDVADWDMFPMGNVDDLGKFTPAVKPVLTVTEGSDGVVGLNEAQDGIAMTLALGDFGSLVEGETIVVTFTDATGAAETVDVVVADGSAVQEFTFAASITNVDADNLMQYTVTTDVYETTTVAPVTLNIDWNEVNVVEAKITTPETSVVETTDVVFSAGSSTGEALSFQWSVVEANGAELTLSGESTDTLTVSSLAVAADTEITVKVIITSGDETSEATSSVTLVNQSAITAQDITIDTVANSGLATGAGDYFTAADTAVLSLAAANTIPGLTIMADGSYSFDPSDAAYASMVLGDAQSLTATVTATDQFGGEATATFTVNVRGVVNTGEQENSDAGSFGGMMALLMLPMAWLRRRRS